MMASWLFAVVSVLLLMASLYFVWNESYLPALGTGLILIGSLLNFLVTWANGNVMPIIVRRNSVKMSLPENEFENYKGKYKIYPSSQGIRLAAFCDRFCWMFEMSNGRKNFISFSMGDFSVFTGIAFLLISLLIGLFLYLLSFLQFLVRVFT